MVRKLMVVIAALLLMALAAGCAGQAGSEASTPVTAATDTVAATPAVAESPVDATDAVTTTEPVTATETISGTAATDTTPAATPVATLEMPAQSETVQTWPVMWDPEIGFEVRYPQGWLVGEAEVTDKDAPITRVYTFQPADWTEDYAPVIVEVSEGTEADFRRMYAAPTATEERNIGPLTYTYETAGSEGSLENFAIFTSPDNPDVRVVVRDTLTGFPDRAAAHADFAALIEQITESFRWRK